jgi:serine protease Do
MRRCHALVALILCLTAAGAARADNFNLRQVRKGVVFVKWIGRDGTRLGSGTGFIVTADGLIYTNRHVANHEGVDLGDARLLVGVPSQKDPEKLDYFPAAIAYIAPEMQADFAILKINAPPAYGPLHPLHLAQNPVDFGQSVATIGYPLPTSELPSLNFTHGVVSATHVDLPDGTFWQTDAAINFGNSGGPMIDEQGEVVGIATEKNTVGQGMGYSLLLSDLKNPADADREFAKLHADPGPLDPSSLPHPVILAPTAANWQLGSGTETFQKNAVTIDNDGGAYWLIAKRPLPRDFRLTFWCTIEYELGDQDVPLGGMNANSLFIRFGTQDTLSKISRLTTGYLIQFSARGLHLAKDRDLVAESNLVMKYNPDAPMPAKVLISLKRQGSKISTAVNDEPGLDFDDPQPIDDSGMLCIGGMLSKLTLQSVTLGDLDQGPATKPAQSK